VYDVMDDRTEEDLIKDVVLEKDDNPLHASAVQAFLEMGTPPIHGLN